MRTYIDKSLILNEIKKKKKFSTDKQFADFLGIKPQTLASWYSRNSFDYELIYAKCGDIDANWLLTGKGSMYKSLQKDISVSSIANEPTVHYESKRNRPIIELKLDNDYSPNTIILDVKAAAGFGTIIENPTKLEQLPAIYTPNAPKGLNIRVSITGDSMHPTVRNSDFVYANHITDSKDIRDGFVYIIFDRYDGLLCKRIYMHGSDFQFVSDNKIFSSYTKPHEDIIGVFKAFGIYSNDFSPFYDDVRKDIEYLKTSVEELKNNYQILDYIKKEK